MRLTLTLAGPMAAMVEALAQARGISHPEAVRYLLKVLLEEAPTTSFRYAGVPQRQRYASEES